MLVQLEIRNIALIDHISIELGEGLNILTGETGAGKSIIIDSIHAILGGRISKESIRTGEEKAGVEAVFQVDPERVEDLFKKYGLDLEEDGTLIISREFNVSGKNTCRINGKMTTVSMLKEIGERLIDIHGQHDNQSLLRVESHIDLLDLFGGDRVQSLKKEYQSLLNQYKEIKHKIKALSGNTEDRERLLDLLQFQMDEIKAADLKIGEEEALEKQRSVLIHAEKIIASLTSSYELLYGGGSSITDSAIDNINKAMGELGSVTGLDSKYEEISKKLEDLSYQLEDVIESLRKEKEGVEYDPDLLVQIEERLDLIYKLKRKYGSSVDDILKYCQKIAKEFNEIVKNEENVHALSEEMKRVDQKLYECAKQLNVERGKAAQVLENRIGDELNALEMKKAQFKVKCGFDDVEVPGDGRRYTQEGLDRIEFMISPNAGEPLKPLAKIASGGEMSRIMLAIKTILAKADQIPTLIFDEIDIGISGKAAQRVGEKLAFLSKNHQVLCVTHLAQIASMSDRHYFIEKISNEKSTRTMVRALSEKDTKSEIARILGGTKISDITLKHAEEMLLNAEKFKNKQIAKIES